MLAHQRLRDEILSGDLGPGARLIQDEIAGRFGVSRIPVRDALRRLEADGMIERFSVGYVVAELDPRGMADLFGLRLRIDGFAAGLCARRSTPEVIAEIGDILLACTAAIERQDYEAFTRFDTAFHEAIYNGADSPQIKKCVFLLWNGAPPIASMRLHPHRLMQAHEEHKRIFESIRAGDFREAEEQSRIHVDRARTAVLSKVADGFALYANATETKNVS